MKTYTNEQIKEGIKVYLDQVGGKTLEDFGSFLKDKGTSLDDVIENRLYSEIVDYEICNIGGEDTKEFLREGEIVEDITTEQYLDRYTESVEFNVKFYIEQENKIISRHFAKMGKKSAESRKGKTDYSALAKKRWGK